MTNSDEPVVKQVLIKVIVLVYYTTNGPVSMTWSHDAIIDAPRVIEEMKSKGTYIKHFTFKYKSWETITPPKNKRGRK